MTVMDGRATAQSAGRQADTVATAREKTAARVRRHRAAQRQAASIEFIRTDASLFLHPDRLSQKAGAPKAHLRRMALKELVDNALDAAPTATIEEVDPDTFIIQDDGPGIDPDRVVDLFSVTRPMMSTKLIRRPTRGAVGNGLRVATGAAFASGGGLVVESRGARQALDFDRVTGETVVTGAEASTVTAGTRITVTFGPALPRDAQAATWAAEAIALAGEAASPMLTHPDWYSDLGFQELTSAARGTAQDLASLFGIDLCNAPRDAIEQGQSDAPERYIDPDGPASQLTLALLKNLAPKPPKLVPIAADLITGVHRTERTVAIVAGATVPAVVQVWADEMPRGAKSDVRLVINRTATVADIAVHVGGDSFIRGCGLDWSHIGSVPKGAYSILIAITTPSVALINDGKTPDLAPFRAALVSAVGSTMRRAHRPTSRGVSIKDAAFEAMEDAYLRASADGTLPANARQIMYAARPYILERTGNAKLADAYFTQTLLPEFMDANPELTANWDVVYDARGHFVEPHTDHSLPLGTLHVREYLMRRPRTDAGALISMTAGLHPTVGPGDRYGAVLFIEKEGFEPLLRASRIAERFDLAVMSTKGMSVVAARALVDRLSSSGLKILVAHDLDMAGIRIFGTLGSDSGRYKFERKPDVHRLGLTLDQAQEMGLQSERQDIKGDQSRLLEGLRAYGASEAELRFIGSGRRVELNAMPSDLFVRWIERGLTLHNVRKVVPPAEVVAQRAREIIGLRHVRADVAALERAARSFAETIKLPVDLETRIEAEFKRNPEQPWEDALARAIEAVTDGGRP